MKFQLRCPGAFQQSASLTKEVQNEHGRSGFKAFLGTVQLKKFQLCFSPPSEQSRPEESQPDLQPGQAGRHGSAAAAPARCEAGAGSAGKPGGPGVLALQVHVGLSFVCKGI